MLLFAACASPPPAVGTTPALRAQPQDAPRSDDETARIARVENGLTPLVRVEGERRWSIDSRLLAHHTPGISVAVIHHHALAWARGYGIADEQTRAPVTEHTLFQAGSTSKTVFALAALSAVKDGALSLDGPINDALTSWKLPENELTRATPVTLRQLLSHTAGTTAHGFPGYAVGAPVPTLLQILDGASPANTEPVRVKVAPGTPFHYSGGGTIIAQQALVDAEKKASSGDHERARARAARPDGEHLRRAAQSSALGKSSGRA